MATNKVLVNNYSGAVEYIGIKADTVSNGIDVGEFIFGQDNSNPLVTAMDLSVPDGVIAHKYCYDAIKGFNLNPAYVAPASQDDVIALQSQMAQTVLALVSGGLM